MPNGIRRTDTDRGWINRRFARIERQIRELASAKRAQATTVGKGGFGVGSEGSLYASYPNGQTAARFGPHDDSAGNRGYGFLLDDEDGNTIFGMLRYPDIDLTSFGVTAGDFATVVADAVTLYRSDFDAFVAVDTDGVTLNVGTGVHRMTGMATTAVAANMNIDSGTGDVSRVVSSRRYKRNIKDAKVDPDAVLALTPRRFRMKADVDKQGKDAPTYVGFIAEEAAALGLDDWVTNDGEGRVDAFDYPTWCVAQQAVMQRQAEQIDALTKRVVALEQGRGT